MTKKQIRNALDQLAQQIKELKKQRKLLRELYKVKRGKNVEANRTN